MQNLRLTIDGEILTITINLGEQGSLSKSGRSEVIASSGGNLRLYDENGYRDERLNITVSKLVPKSERTGYGYR